MSQGQGTEGASSSYTKNAELTNTVKKQEGYTNHGFAIDDVYDNFSEKTKRPEAVLQMDTESHLLENEKQIDRKNRSSTADKCEKMVVALDGGWAWVVCFACFMQCFVYDGIFYTFGIIFLDLTDHFHSDKETGAWISSINFAVCMTTGPLISALSDKFGFRAVTIAGAITTCGGLLMSCFAINIPCLYVSYGVIAGLGYGMVCQPSITAVTLYFKKKRSFATGLSLCGNGLGLFAMSPLTEWLLQNYSWSGTFLIQGALLLNGIVCGLIYRPLPTEYCIWDQIPINKKNSKECTHVVLVSEENVLHNHLQRESIDKEYEIQNVIEDHKTIQNIEKDLTKTNRRNIRDAKPLNCIFENAVWDKVGDVKKISRHFLVETFDMSLLADVPFCLYTVSSALYSLAYHIPFIYLPDLANHAGIDTFRSSLLLSAVGIANVLSRVLFGVLLDHPGVNRVNMYSVCVFFSGLAVILIPVCRSFEILLGISILFGLFQGLSAILVYVLIADLVGAQDACKAVGILHLFSGIATFVGTPFGGWMYDVTRNYDVTFYVSGTIISISGAMLFVIPILTVIKGKKTEGEITCVHEQRNCL